MSAYIPKYVSVAWCERCGEPLAVHVTNDLAKARALGGQHLCGSRGTTVAAEVDQEGAATVVVREYRMVGGNVSATALTICGHTSAPGEFCELAPGHKEPHGRGARTAGRNKK